MNNRCLSKGKKSPQTNTFGPAFTLRSNINEEDLKMSEGDQFLTTKEAAALLRISPLHLLTKTSNGKIPYYKLGRSNLYRKSELLRMILKEKRGPRCD